MDATATTGPAELKRLLLGESARLAEQIRPALGKIGDNQWRSLVAACQEAEAVEEVRALLAYKTGKNEGEREDKRGWAMRVGDRRAGDHVLSTCDGIIQTLQEKKQDEAAVLNALALFFGYMSWRVVALRGVRGGERE